MDIAKMKALARELPSSGLARRLLHKFIRTYKECPDNRSMLGMHERIRGDRVQTCTRQVCGEASQFAGRICIWHRQ